MKTHSLAWIFTWIIFSGIHIATTFYIAMLTAATLTPYPPRPLVGADYAISAGIIAVFLISIYAGAKVRTFMHPRLTWPSSDMGKARLFFAIYVAMLGLMGLFGFEWIISIL